MASDFPTARVSLWVPCTCRGGGLLGMPRFVARSHRQAAGKCLGPEDLQHSAEVGRTGRNPEYHKGTSFPHSLRPLPRAWEPLYQAPLVQGVRLWMDAWSSQTLI